MRLSNSGVPAIALALVVLSAAQAGAQAGSQGQVSPHSLSKECNEYALIVRLDPGPFQDFVGSRFSLALEEGKARILVAVQDCSQYRIDGKDLGPTQEVLVWVMIQGAAEVRPVVGAEQTQPTRSWFALFTGSNNPRVRAAKEGSGIVVHPIDGVHLDPPGPQRGGRASLGGALELSWLVPSPAAPPVRQLGVNHDVFFRDAAGNVLLNRVQALAHVAAGFSQGTLKVAGKLEALPFISPGTYQVSVRAYFPISVRTTLGLPGQAGISRSER